MFFFHFLPTLSDSSMTSFFFHFCVQAKRRNKAGYAAIPVADGWEGAVMQKTKIKYVMDQSRDEHRQTDGWTERSGKM